MLLAGHIIRSAKKDGNRVIGAILTVVCLSNSPAWGQDQSPPRTPPETGQDAVALSPDIAPRAPRWDLTLGGQVGFPGGHLQVGETGAAGTRLSLRSDLGINVSEAVEFGAAYHFTARDAIRTSFLYYFLDGSATTNQPVVYNGLTIHPGPLHTNADFWQVTLAYERTLLALAAGGHLIGSAGLTYVYFNPKVNNNSEDFYLQELPVPLLGVRLDYPVGDRLTLTASLAGGILPWVNSGRKEGGTVYLTQSHADVGLGLAYALTPALRVEGSYQLRYFTQHEVSHEDNNAFLLLDNGFRLSLTYRF